MIFQRLILLYVLSLLLCIGLVEGESVEDPYQILEKHYAVVGGLEVLKAMSS